MLLHTITRRLPMRQKSFIGVITLLAFLASCKGPETQSISIISPLPSGVVPSNGALSFMFSRAVVPVDSTNHWSVSSFIEFTPAIPGKFVWQDTSRLIFSPDGALPGDTRFTGRINTALLTQLSGAASFDGDESFQFSTESFRLITAEFFYDRVGQTRTIGLKANLTFTYPVRPEDVQRTVRITVDDQPHQSIRAASPNTNRIIALDLGTVGQAQQEKKIAVTFETDLLSPETNTHIKIEKPFVFKLPGLEEIKISSHDFGFDGKQGWIRFTTSQEVDLSAAKKFITVDPARDFSLEGDERSFTLRGLFQAATPYHVTVRKGMESYLGGKIQNDYPADITFGNIAPSFRFASESGVYMLLGGAKTLDITTVNLSQVYARVSQIFQNNLVFFLDQGRYYDYYWDDYDPETGGGTYSRKYRYAVGNYGRQINFDTLDVKSVTNQEVTTPYNIAPFMNTGYKGFYLVEIANPQEPWRTTSKLVVVSDIGLIVKRSANELVVFATSLETNEPLANVLITLVSTNNQVMSSTKTDKGGVVRLSNLLEMQKTFQLKLVTAELESDFNFLNLADYRVETSRFDVAGKRDVANRYDVFVYGDRNIYRPGETIRLSAIVRELTKELPAKLPVRLKIYNPLGTVIQEQHLTLNEYGSCEAQYQTASTSPTGEYRFEIYTGNNLYLSSYKVSVEDFVPDRLKVHLQASAEDARPGDRITYNLQAFNFFGPPAAGRSWEFEASFVIAPYISKRFPDFRFFDDAAKNYSAPPDVMTGKTDNDGKTLIGFNVPDNLTSTGILKARGRVAVFDESGRPVYQLAQTIVYPREYFIGVRQRGSYYVSPNTPQKMQIIAVDTKDSSIKGFSATIDLIRLEWHSILRQHPGTKTLRYVSEQREVLVKSDALRLADQPVEYTYTVPRSGEYVMRVSRDGESGYNQFRFYAYSWGTTDITSFAVNPEARIEVVFDKDKYAPGEKAKALFQAPFDGKMLVCVERNSVFSYHYLDVVHNSASMDIDVTDAFLPNVYISAVLFRKIKDQDIPLMVGHGIAPLMVEKASNKINVTIEAPEKIRPKTKQKVVVIAGERNIAVTLAAVDEGILQVKNYSTPNPYEYFYTKKALQTETFDFFKDLLPESKGSNESSSGGGEGAELAKRVNPLGVQRFKPLAIWSGILTTDGNGRVEVMLDVPEFSGELRLMAIAYKGDHFGSIQKAMKVADPVIITPALPRFVSPGDSLTMPITAFNTTEKSTTLRFRIETTGGITTMATSATLEVGPNQERFVSIPLAATNRIGKAVVRVKTEAFGEEMESITEIPVRPIAPFVAEGITGFVDAGTPVRHDIGVDYLPYNRAAHLVLSPFPVANFARELKHLVGYPHGCLEQTVSKAFPQVYLRDIASLLAPEILNNGSPTYFVNEAITKLGTMQLSDGSFAYWPGGGYANKWSTVYATHFLLESKRAGYAVSEAMLSAAVGAVARIARTKAVEDLYYYETQKTLVKRVADKSVLYGLYVLAVAGSPEKQLMQYYRAEKSLLTTDTQYLLAGSFALAGDRRTYTELLPPQFTTPQPVRTSGYNFDSPLRANALILNVLLDTDLNNNDIPRYMDYLSRTYRTYRWYSTQDDAFTLLAFGKAARMASATKVTGTINVGEQRLNYEGGNRKWKIDPFGTSVQISTRGEGRVYYSLVTEGIRADGRIPIEDKNLQVRREYLDRTGTAVGLSTVKQNDLLVVRLSINCSVDNLENVAITDMLPAGFEIENPRLTETTNYSFIKNASPPEYLDIRDDRMNLYTSFKGRKQQVFYYLVRAVTQGDFVHAPVVAEAMYDANYYSASGAGKVRVGK